MWQQIFHFNLSERTLETANREKKHLENNMYHVTLNPIDYFSPYLTSKSNDHYSGQIQRHTTMHK
jgi:hypothetical protein